MCRLLVLGGFHLPQECEEQHPHMDADSLQEYRSSVQAATSTTDVRYCVLASAVIVVPPEVGYSLSTTLVTDAIMSSAS